MAYLEQSTRYVPYTDRPGGRLEVPRARGARRPSAARCATSRPSIARSRPTRAGSSRMQRLLGRARCRASPARPSGPWRMTIRAKALDSLRGLLPAATRSNVGIFGTGAGLRGATPPHARAPAARGPRLRGAHARRAAQGDPGLSQAPRAAGARRSVVAVPRGYARRPRAAVAEPLLAGIEPEPRPEVTLTDWDPDGEVKVVAAALYAVSDLPDDQLLALARKLGPEERRRVLDAYVGARENRRHKPGRAFERTALPLRRAGRLRRLPRPAAPPAAHAGVAAALDAARLACPETRSRRRARSRTGPA